MGVAELPDGEPQAMRYNTVGEYAKAYIDWKMARLFVDIEKRLKQLERAQLGPAKGTST